MSVEEEVRGRKSDVRRAVLPTRQSPDLRPLTSDLSRPDPDWSLVTTHAATIRRAANRYAYAPLLDADDLFQEAAIKVARSPHLSPGCRDVPAYVYRVAASACLDALRRVFGRPGSYRAAAMLTRASLDAVHPDTDSTYAERMVDESAADPAATTEHEWAQQLVWRLLGATTERRRDILHELYLDETPQTLVARRRGVCTSAITHARNAALADLAAHYRTLTAA